MNTKYKDLIEQTFDFPQEEFHTENGNLLFGTSGESMFGKRRTMFFIL